MYIFSHYLFLLFKWGCAGTFYLWFCIYITVRIMPLKAFNVPVSVCLSLFLEGEAPKCPPPTLNFLPSVRARDSWNSWDTGEWSTEPPKSVSGTGTAGPPSACSSTQPSYPPEPAAEWGNDTEPARCDESPIIRQWSSDKWWQNGPGLSLSLSAVWHGVMVISCWVNSSPRITSRNLMLSHLCNIVCCITFSHPQIIQPS